MSRLDGRSAELGELSNLKSAVRSLQRNAKDQCELERETQRALEHLTSQVDALKTAFKTLGDVLLDEVDAVRNEAAARSDDTDAKLDRTCVQVETLAREVDLVRRSGEALSSKERDWAKDNELLKAQGARVGNWIQTLQRDIGQAKDQVGALRAEHSSRCLQVSEEAAALRRSWKTASDALQERVGGIEAALAKVEVNAHAVDQARLGDLELVERAMTTLRRQQQRLRANVEENFSAISTDTKTAAAQAQEAHLLAKKNNVDLEQAQKLLGEVQNKLIHKLAVIDQLIGQSV